MRSVQVTIRVRATLRGAAEDPRDTRKGVERQREDCEALVAARGWELVDVWSDNDVAVLRSGADRPGHATMIAAAERGEITRIVAYGLTPAVVQPSGAASRVSVT